MSDLIARVEVVGSSPAPRVLITGGVHGDEYEPMVAIRRLIVDLRSRPVHGAVTLVPVVNESAFLLGRRVGEDGLDLARNCPGRPDGSITERIADELSRLIRSADYYIDLHTGGTRLRVLPMVGFMLHRDAAVLDSQRRMARAFGLPIIWGTDPNLEGRSLSVARDANVPAIYAEYQGGGEFDSAGVEAYIEGCRRVLIELAVLEGTVTTESPAIVVEDSNPGSGHMQASHPAACEGFFEPAVALGQSVRSGDSLGTIMDPLGNRVEPVRARSSGLVLVLHMAGRIDVGEGVAVILPTDGGRE